MHHFQMLTYIRRDSDIHQPDGEKKKKDYRNARPICVTVIIYHPKSHVIWGVRWDLLAAAHFKTTTGNCGVIYMLSVYSTYW